MKTPSAAGFACAVFLLGFSSCGPMPPSGPLRPAVSEWEWKVMLDGQRVAREGLAVPATGYEWALPRGARGRLRFAWTPTEKRGNVSLDVEMLSQPGGKSKELRRFPRVFPVAGPPAFFDEDLPLAVAPGGLLRFSATPAGAFFVSDLRIVQPSTSADALILLVFDTTRRDGVGLYGCSDPSTPNLDVIFRRGFKADRAYAPASWTIPSVASLLTGRVPAAHEGVDGTPRGIVPGIATLAEDLRRAGFSTGAFVANPTLRADNGFAAGFTTFFTTPYEGGSIVLPGSETAKHVPAWLSARRGEPFFLFLLLMDPHDPYAPADRPRGVTPFDPDYKGSITGDEVHRLQIGLLPKPPERDIRHLSALYHDEVRLADSVFGELWKQFEQDLGKRATVVFTSDHGEELGEHGGWKHGPSLFDEILRVPLAIRPGNRRRPPKLPAGALVSLLDVLPTLEALLAVAAPARPLDGLSLFAPEAARREVLPPMTMLTGGPPRAAVVRHHSKLFFFDRLGTRGIPDSEKDPDGYRLARRLPEILPAFGRFDLSSDPGEEKLLPPDEASLPSDWRAIEHAWGGTREGLEIRLLGGAAKLSLRINGFPKDARAQPFARKEADTFSWDCGKTGCALKAEVTLARDVEGFSVTGAASDLALSVDGGCAALVLEGSRPLTLTRGEAEKIPRDAIHAALPSFVPPKNCTGIFLWRSTGRRDLPPRDTDEAIKKLRALGYLH